MVITAHTASLYRQANFLSVISKHSEAIINKKVVDHLSRNNFLRDKPYRFRSAQSTADILTAITHRIMVALDNKYISRIVLYISMAFDRMWYEGLPHKLSSFGNTGRNFSIIKSFITGRSLNVIVYDQSSKALEIKEGVHQGSNLAPTDHL